MGRDRDRGRPGVPSLHVGEPVGSGSPTALKCKEVRTSAIVILDQHTKLSTNNANPLSPPATTQRRSNTIKKRAHVPQVSDNVKPSPNTDKENSRPSLQQPQMITTCPYCAAIKTDTAWPSQEPTTKLFEPSAQDFDITHEQFTTRASRELSHPQAACIFS